MLSDKGVLENALRVIKEKPELFEALLEYERTGKLPKITYKKRVNFTIDSEIFREFRNYCEKRGLNMSNLIERFMEKQIHD